MCLPKPPTETELKFLIAPEQADDLRSHSLLRGAARTVRLRSVYYDTSDLDLRGAGISLRVRQTGQDYVQTVKAANVGDMERGEWESPVETEAVDYAALAVTPVAEILQGRAGALTAMFSTMVERRSRLVRFDGARIEASLDHGDVVCGETSEPIEELELELKSGKASSLFALAGELCRATIIRLSLESKAERGARLRDGSATAARKTEAVNLTAQMSSMEGFQAIARASLAQVTANAEVLRRIRRPEALHQLRIGLRRLRTATSIFKAMLADDGRPIELELEWLAGELDPARDIEVFATTTFRMAAKAPDKTGLMELGRHLQKAKRQAYDRALAALASRRYAMLALQVAAWIEAGAWTRAQDPVLAHLRSVPVAEHRILALDHLRHAVRTRGRKLERLDPKARHKLRIRAKRVRYTVEFFSSLSSHPKREARFLATLKAMQDQLGELNDIAVARERLLTDAAVKDPLVAFAAGRAVGRRELDEPGLIQAAVKGYSAFESAAPFWR
jgi:triphosphatase